MALPRYRIIGLLLFGKNSIRNYVMSNSITSFQLLSVKRFISNKEVLILAHKSRTYSIYKYPASVRPSVVNPSLFSKDFSFEATWPILSILHTEQVGGTKMYVFCFGRIRTLVAMST